MESNQNRIWLFVFVAVVAIGGFLWWRGGSAPEVAPEAVAPVEEPAIGIQAPAGSAQATPDFGAPAIPSAPAARTEQGRPDSAPPNFDQTPPPGFMPPPTTFENFAPPPDPGNSFDEVPNDAPPQAFENPEFVAPPPPPPQFDTEPLPFDEGSPFDQGGGGGMGDALPDGGYDD